MGMEKETPDDGDDRYAEHLSDIEDGCGCTEIWEQLVEGRSTE